MSSQVTEIPTPGTVSAEAIRRRIESKSQLNSVNGAFPALLPRSWRMRLAELTGTKGLIPGKPIIAAIVGQELWLYSCQSDLEIGNLLATYRHECVSPIEGVEPPTFTVAGHRLQVSIDWFDVARVQLAKLRTAD